MKPVKHLLLRTSCCITSYMWDVMNLHSEIIVSQFTVLHSTRTCVLPKSQRNEKVVFLNPKKTMRTTIIPPYSSNVPQRISIYHFILTATTSMYLIIHNSEMIIYILTFYIVGHHITSFCTILHHFTLHFFWPSGITQCVYLVIALQIDFDFSFLDFRICSRKKWSNRLHLKYSQVEY